jgi:hypothetical protein
VDSTPHLVALGQVAGDIEHLLRLSSGLGLGFV